MSFNWITHRSQETRKGSGWGFKKKKREHRSYERGKGNNGKEEVVELGNVKMLERREYGKGYLTLTPFETAEWKLTTLDASQNIYKQILKKKKKFWKSYPVMGGGVILLLDS